MNETVGERYDHLETLLETTIKFLSQPDSANVLETIVRSAAGLLDAMDGFLYLPGGSFGDLELKKGLGIYEHLTGQTIKAGEGLEGQVWSTGKPAWIDDYDCWPERPSILPPGAIGSLVAVPLKSGTRLTGLLGLSFPRANKRFGEPEAALLFQFARIAAAALENSRRYASTQQQIIEYQRVIAAHRESETQYRLIAENARDIIWIRDLDLYPFYVSPSITRLCGYSTEQAMRQSLFDTMTPESADRARLVFQDMLQAAAHQSANELATQTRTLEIETYCADGSTLWFETTVSFILDEHGKPFQMLGVAHNVTQRRRSEEALRKSEERYALAARGASDGLWDWDLDSDRVYYSPRWKEMLGCAEQEIGDVTDEWFARVHPSDLRQLRLDLARHLDGSTAHFETEYRILHSEGKYRWMLCRGLAVRDADGRAHRVAGSQTDITRRKEAEERLLYDALHEPLTSLPNRTMLLDRLDQAIKAMRRHPETMCAILFIDLDRFKIINDSLGHHVGDELLIETAKRLEACFRPSDTVARFGGDEFAILLNDLKTPADAAQAAERVQRALMHPFRINDRELTLSASIGIALTSSEDPGAGAYEAPEEMLRDADVAMYQAKAQGRARYAVFDASMHSRVVTILQVEEDIRGALERGEFEVFYQPIFSAVGLEITGAEALVRWHDPKHGLVPPAKFIPIAEESELIVALDSWVLRTACAMAARWRGIPAGERLDLYVNCSARNFQDPHWPATIRQVLADTNLPGQLLALEITESTAMRDVESTLRTFAELSAMGVRISIDDFGNRYSALGYLKRFPFSSLKIDQSFLRNIAQDTNNAALTTAIIDMARTLHLRVIAEGVESQDQLEFLRERHCDEVQGFLLSRPLTAPDFQKLLERADNRRAAQN